MKILAATIAILGILATPFAGMAKPCAPKRPGCCALKVVPPCCCQGPMIGAGCDCFHSAQRSPLDRELVAQAPGSRPERSGPVAVLVATSLRDVWTARSLFWSHDPPAPAQGRLSTTRLLC